MSTLTKEQVDQYISLIPPALPDFIKQQQIADLMSRMTPEVHHGEQREKTSRTRSEDPFEYENSSSGNQSLNPRSTEYEMQRTPSPKRERSSEDIERPRSEQNYQDYSPPSEPDPGGDT